MVRLLSFFTLLFAYLAASAPTHGQSYCPPGSIQVPNANSPGASNYMCQCPDGSYASIYGCQGSSVSPPQNSQLRYCENGGACRLDQTCCGDRCCNQGSYCTRFGCTPIGAIDCGAYYCKPGEKCARNRRGCYPNEVVDCGDYSCQPGQRCAMALRACLSEADTDCGAHICPAGYYCGSHNTCTKIGDDDCGNGSSCPSDNKCSRDGKHCIPKDAVDCGDHFCKEGYKCGSGEQCLVTDAVDCGKGNSCAAGYVCRKEGGCATREQLAAELDAKRRDISSAKPPTGIQVATNWGKERMRRARSMPLPELAIIFEPLPPGPPPLRIEVLPPSDIPSAREALPARLLAPPLKWAGKLFYRRPEGDWVCSAQFIAPHVILTAAHCVRDHDTGKYFSNFAFALQYDKGNFSHRYGWKCAVTPAGWTSHSDDAWQWDYAMLLADDVSKTGHFGTRYGWQGAYDHASKIGYPKDVASGEIMQVDEGSLVVGKGLVKLNHGNPNSGKGSSGGAWVGKYSASDQKDANFVLSLTSFGRTEEPGVAYGPYFNDEFKRLLDYVSSGCP